MRGAAPIAADMDAEWFCGAMRGHGRKPSREAVEAFVERVAVVWAEGVPEENARKIAIEPFLATNKGEERYGAGR